MPPLDFEMIMIKKTTHFSSQPSTKPNVFLPGDRECLQTEILWSSRPPDTEMCEENSFRVTGTAGAGLGILSTRRILRGEIILQEKPLLLVESKIKENEYSWFDL